MFCEIHKIGKPLIRLIKRKGEKIQVISIRNERGDINKDFIPIKRIKSNFRNSIPVNLMTLGEANEFLKRQNLSKVTQEKTQSG